MKYPVRFVLLLLILLSALGCATVSEQKDNFFIPTYLAESGLGEIDTATLEEGSLTFRNIDDLTTAAFYKGTTDIKLKKTAANAISMVASRTENINKYHPNLQDVLVLKTGINQGYSLTLLLLSSFMESSYPNYYPPQINVDLNQSTEDLIEHEYALLAINRGNKPLKDLYIIDVLPEPVQFEQAFYSPDDLFIPLNVELAQVKTVEHTYLEKDNKKMLIFHVVPLEEGIQPGALVEILVKAKIDKKILMQPKYKVAE